MQHLVTGYLRNLPDHIYPQLYGQPASCLAVYRLLPPLSQQIIARLLFIQQPVSFLEILAWGNESAKNALEYALEQCKSLKCLVEVNSYFHLNETFRIQFQNALSGAGDEKSFGSLASAPDRHPTSVAFLDQYAKEQWESVLRYMVGKHDAKPHTAVVNLLEKSGLMKRKYNHDEPTITYRGFQFLLQDVNSQVWALLLQYLSLAEELGMEEVDVLNFLFLLCSLELGSGYSSENLSLTQSSVLADMIAFGIVFRRKKKAKRFYPTRLATTLTTRQTKTTLTTSSNFVYTHSFASSNGRTLGMQGPHASVDATSTMNHGNENTGFILVETNFRVYAYTYSDLHLAILDLFVDIKTRFPNFVSGLLTHTSVLKAYRKGISAHQIIQFLKDNAHPRMRQSSASNSSSSSSSSSSVSILPPTIIDQLVLWELELHRVQLMPAKLITEFLKQEEYDNLRKFANSIDAVIWSDEKKWKLVVKEEKYQLIVEHGRRMKEMRENLMKKKKLMT